MKAIKYYCSSQEYIYTVQYQIHEKCIQPPNVKDTNSLLSLLWDRFKTLEM